MTPITDMIEKMTAEGVPMHVILLAVKTVELTVANGKVGGHPVDKAAEKRRAYDRERMAQKRMSADSPPTFMDGISTNPPPESTGQSADSPPTSQTASSLLSKKKKKEANREKSGGQSEQRRMGHRLPDDWRPSESHFAEAAELHRTRSQVEAKAEEMRLWAQANGHRAVARKLDWDAAFRGWMRRDWGKPNGSAPPPRSGIEGII